ncbi:hypothetical protein BHE74_00034311 [Ensete ventricosum]|nr:hypothetical protein BHE74_00034311 [Ensete ventricosum]
MSAYIHLPHRILLRTGTLAVIRAVHRAYTQRAVPHLPARHHVDTVSAGHPRDLAVWKLARRLVAQRAVLAHWRYQRSPCSRDSRVTEVDLRHRDLIRAHLKVSCRRRRRRIR